MKFTYKARNKEGELQTGSVEAANRNGAISILTSHDLFILTLESAEQKHWYDFFLGFLNRVRLKDLMVFTRQFATILSAKIPLNDALTTLHRQTRNQVLKDAIFEMSSDIDAGLSLSQSIEKHADIFSPFYVNMVRSAELTGRVEEAMNYLADYVEKESLLVGKIRNALIYPAIMVALFLVIAGFMGAVVLPKIEPIFTESGVELPFITSFLISIGKFLADWWWLVVLAITGLVVLTIDYVKSPEGKNTMDEVFLRLPVFGNLFRNIYVSRFAEAVSILVKGGISIPQAMEVAAETIGSTVYGELLRGSAEDVRRGELLSQSLSKNENYFPPLLVQMISIGEATGKLEDMLARVATFYNREVDSLVGSLVELIQPMLMVFIGLAVGGLFASILVPIFNLSQRI